MLWERTALMGGFAVAVLAFLLHSRMTWLYFGPSPADVPALLPGPFFAGEWGPHLLRLLGAGLFFLSLPGLGKTLLPRNRTFPPFTATAVALIAWSTAGFLIAAAGKAHPAFLRAASLVLVGTGLVKARPFPAMPRRSPLLLASAAFAFLYFLTTLVPDTFYDALVYHLAAPQLWLQTGRMADMPDVYLWRLPGLLQPLYLWALAWSDDRLCKLLVLGFGLLTAGLLGRWASDRWKGSAGGWAALLFLSCPMIGVNLWACANDVPAAFFAFLALVLWEAAWSAPRALPALNAPEDRAALFLAGVFFGAGTAVKTTALFAAPFFVADLLLVRRRGGRGAFAPLLLFAAGFVLPLLPWWTRTGTWTGNPFFPQAAAFLGGDTAANVALLKGWHAESGGSGGFLTRSLSIVRESLRGVDEGRFGFVGPVLLMLLPLAFFLREDPAHGLLAGASFTAYAVFIAATGRLRYFIPHLPPLFALSAACLAGYAGAAARAPWKFISRLGPALIKLTSLAVAVNFLWLALAFGRFNQGWPVVFGREAPADYLRREHMGVYGHPSQGAFDALRSAGVQGKLFMVGEARSFRAPVPAAASASFNVPAFAVRFEAHPRPEDFIASLKADGFTHFLVNTAEMRRITPGPYRDRPHLRALAAVMDRLPPPLYRDAWCLLFALP